MLSPAQAVQIKWYNKIKMAKLKLRSKDIRAIGYPEGPVISIAMNIMEKKFKFERRIK